MKLADNIIRLRRLRGWSQEELAERLGVSRQSVSKWEGEQSQPDLPRVVEMSRIFGVSTDCLLGLSELPDSCSGTPSQPEQAPEQAGDRACPLSLPELQKLLRQGDRAGWMTGAGVFCLITLPVPSLLLPGLSRGMLLALTLLPLLLAVGLFLAAEGLTRPQKIREQAGFTLEPAAAGLLRERLSLPRSVWLQGTGILLCLSGCAPLLLTDGSPREEAGLAATLLLLGAGVLLLLLEENRTALSKRLLRQSGRSRRLSPSLTEVLENIYWLAAAGLYLWSGLSTGSWDTNWLIWPAAGILYAILELAGELPDLWRR